MLSSAKRLVLYSLVVVIEASQALRTEGGHTEALDPIPLEGAIKPDSFDVEIYHDALFGSGDVTTEGQPSASDTPDACAATESLPPPNNQENGTQTFASAAGVTTPAVTSSRKRRGGRSSASQPRAPKKLRPLLPSPPQTLRGLQAVTPADQVVPPTSYQPPSIVPGQTSTQNTSSTPQFTALDASKRQVFEDSCTCDAEHSCEHCRSLLKEVVRFSRSKEFIPRMNAKDKTKIEYPRVMFQQIGSWSKHHYVQRGLNQVYHYVNPKLASTWFKNGDCGYVCLNHNAGGDEMQKYRNHVVLDPFTFQPISNSEAADTLPWIRVEYVPHARNNIKLYFYVVPVPATTFVQARHFLPIPHLDQEEAK